MFKIIKYSPASSFTDDGFSECFTPCGNIPYFLKWISSFLLLQTYSHQDSTPLLNTEHSFNNCWCTLFLSDRSTDSQIFPRMCTFYFCPLFFVSTKLEDTTIKILWNNWMRIIWIYRGTDRNRMSTTLSILNQFWSTKRSLHWNYCPDCSNS